MISQFHVLETEEAYIVQPEVTVFTVVYAGTFSDSRVPEIEARAAVVYPQQRTIMVGFNVTF